MKLDSEIGFASDFGFGPDGGKEDTTRGSFQSNRDMGALVCSLALICTTPSGKMPLLPPFFLRSKQIRWEETLRDDP